jgi:glycosyltransferase involved in cell wall biosynthesis
MSKVKIAIIFTGYNIEGGGGAERRFLRVWRELLSEDTFEVFLITNQKLADGAFTSNIIDGKEVGLIVVPDKPLLVQIAKIIQYLENNSVDIVHFALLQKSMLPLYIYLAIKKRKIKTIQTIALSTLAHGVENDKLLLILDRFVIRLAFKVDSLYQTIQSNPRYSSYRKKIYVTPGSFTNYDLFQYNKEQKSQTILFCGRLIKEKNPHLYLDAILKIGIDNLQNWKFIICGEGPLLNELEMRISSDNLSRFVSIIKTGDTSKVFREASIFVSLQSTENYPSQAVLEAMASGAVVIATDVGDTSRLINHNHTGILTSMDSGSIANAIELLINDIRLRQRLAETARNFVLENHKIDGFKKYLKDLWRI